MVERARFVPDRRSHCGQSRFLAVSGTVDPQVSQSAGSRAAAPSSSQADSTASLLPPAGPQAQGWTGKCKSSRCQSLVEVGIHPLAISQDRPSRLGPAGEGRSDSGCSTFTRGAKPATRRVADGERMNPQGKGGAFAPRDDEHQGDEQPRE